MNQSEVNITGDNIFQVHNVPGDGNCFFLCLSPAFHDNFSMSSAYRKMICNHIVENWHSFENHTEIQQYGSSSVYYNQMSLGNNFASSCEIEVAASLLQQQINVWLECKNNSGITSHILSTFQPSTH